MGSTRGMTHRWVDVHGLRLHCVQAGTGPLVVLLHGFPEFWYAWRHQIPALADAGYRVVAPDLPGYNTSDKPRRVRDYRPRVLVQEVADLIVALGADSAAVAGHDWGGGWPGCWPCSTPSASSGWWSSTPPIRSTSSRAWAAPGPACRRYISGWLPGLVAAQGGATPAAPDLAARHRPLRRRRRPGRAASAPPSRPARGVNPVAQVHLRRVGIARPIVWGEACRA